MKKYLFLPLLPVLFAASPALAQSSPMTGLYVGVQGGYSWTDVDTGAAGVDFDLDGGEYGVFVGYQIDELLNQTVGRLGIGLNGALEVYYTESNADDEFAGVDLEKDHDWGVTFRPGFTFLDPYSPFGAKPYGIIGYRNTEFKGSGFGLSDDEDFDGFELGLGAEVMAYEQIGVRLDYSHTWYEEKDGIEPDEDNIRVGVAYHF